jgi:hypothetical protein
VTGIRGRKYKKLLDNLKEKKIMETEIGSSIFTSEENSL